ncbi:MAG: helix-turn-helix transcriptional regulator [Solirubrobacterales bacterium]|nr:helix-turn-helix transcriptional regulator [Solirubrobacterales bacterium]
MISAEVGARFGANLKRVRKGRGISQEELAFMSEIHRTEAGMLERGIRLPRIDTFVKLCGSLDAEPNDLLWGIVWMPGELTRGGLRAFDDEPPTPGGDVGVGSDD